MPSPPARSARSPLADSLANLRATGVIPAVAEHLASTVPATLSALRAAVLAEIPAFNASGNPDVLPGLARHAQAQLEEIARLLATAEAGDFEFVREHARLRAEQHFPLETTLHAYRCGHRVVEGWLRDTAATVKLHDRERAFAAIADFNIAYTDVISSAATAEYVAHTRRLTEAEVDQRTQLMSLLLTGYDESDGRVAQTLKRAGYLEQRLSYCVVVVRAAQAAEMESQARVQRIIAAITEAATALPVRQLTGTRNGLVTAILSARRRESGWTAPSASLSGRLQEQLLLLGPSVLVGISADHPSTSYLPRALQEATTALDFASLTRRVVSFSSLPLRSLLLRRGALLYNIWDSRAEGMATAMEEFMLHAGLYDDNPRAREIVWILLAQRAARGLGSLYAHANLFTMKEAADFHVAWTPRGWMREDLDLLGFEQGLYLRQPGYGTSYLTGKYLLEQLLQERSKQLGDAFTSSRWFDEVNQAGLIPVSLIRWQLTGRDEEIRALTRAD